MDPCARTHTKYRKSLLHAWELESLKHGKYAVKGLERVKKSKGGNSRASAGGSVRKNSYLDNTYPSSKHHFYETRGSSKG